MPQIASRDAASLDVRLLGAQASSPSNRRWQMFRTDVLALHTLRVAVYVRPSVKSNFANS